MKKLLIYGLIFLLLAVSVQAATINDNSTIVRGNSAGVTACVGVRFHINDNETEQPVNLTKLFKDSAAAQTHWYIYNGSVVTSSPAQPCANMQSAAIQSGTFSGFTGTIAGGQIINTNRNYTFGTDCNGGSCSMTYGAANALPKIGNSTRVTYDGGLSANQFDLHSRTASGIEYDDLTAPTPGTYPYAHLAIRDLYNASTIAENFTCYMGTDINYSNGNTCYFYNHTTGLNYTINDGTYYWGTSNTTTENTTATINLTGAIWHTDTLFALGGTSITAYYNVTTPETTWENVSIGTDIYLQTNGLTNVQVNATGWYDKNYTVDMIGGKIEKTSNLTGLANSYLIFEGSTTGDTYTPTCYVEGTILTNDGSYYALPTTGNVTLECLGQNLYEAFNQTFVTPSYVLNATINISEYRIVLDFDVNTTGYIAWYGPLSTDWKGQIPHFENSTPYDPATFQLVQIRSNFTDAAYVKVRFNNGTNGTGQKYNFINEFTSTLTENLTILTNLDTAVYVSVENLGKELLEDAIVRIELCPTENTDDCTVVNQIVSGFDVSDAILGDLVWLDSTKNYFVTVTKQGYQTLVLFKHGEDFASDNTWDLTMLVSDNSWSNQYGLFCPHYYGTDINTLYCTVTSYETGDVFYNTSFHPAIIDSITLQQGGGYFTLNRSYYDDNNVTITAMTRTAGIYTEIGSWTSLYSDDWQYDLKSELTQGERTTAGFAWAIIIILAALIGARIKRDEVDTGWATFGIGTVVVGIFFEFILPVAAVVMLSWLGTMIFSTTRE